MPDRKHRTLSLPTIDRLFLKVQGTPADIAASESLGQLLEQVAGEILETAQGLTKHAGRKTINDADIILAFEQWRQKKVFKGLS